jgi:nucleotide-binding universal stress UspA family protein
VVRTVVVGVNRHSAGHVAPVGAELARKLGARMVLAHVQRESPLWSARARRERARHRSVRPLRQFLDSTRAALPPDVDVTHRIEHGAVAEQLGRIAKDVDAGLIVVGSRGRGAVASALLGSTSQALGRDAPCPVTIVPDAGTDIPDGLDGSPRDRAAMVAGTDDSTASIGAARFAEVLAAGLDHSLILVRLRDRSRSRGDALQAIALSAGARMIVVAADLRDGDPARLRSTLATRLPRAAQCPVTVVPSETAMALGAAPAPAAGED